MIEMAFFDQNSFFLIELRPSIEPFPEVFLAVVGFCEGIVAPETTRPGACCRSDWFA